MEFIDQCNSLNKLSEYPQLIARSKSIGYNVGQVVFRGYYASPTLQNMHDKAIQARNQLKIQVKLHIAILIQVGANMI
jgi:hypothetical protein